MNKKLEYKNFDLRKVKVNSKKGLDVEFFDLTQKNDLFTVSSDSVPAEEFETALAKLKEILCKSLGLNVGWDFARDHNRKNDEALKQAIHSYADEIERCNVTGFSSVGNNEGIKITGSLKCDLGTVGLASPTIKFSEEEFLIGSDVAVIVEEIKAEVWAFIYKGKRANDLFNTDVVDAQQESGLNNLKAV